MDSEPTRGPIDRLPTALDEVADDGPTDSPSRRSGLGFWGWLRWGWRQLTSMRTALLLLFLLALASVPGSILPQIGPNNFEVSEFLRENPVLGEWLYRLGLFDVFAAPWFVAVYVLLFISLIGCVIPRTRIHIAALRAQPPSSPARPARLPESRTWTTIASADSLADLAQDLRRSRWRVREGADEAGGGPSEWVSAEKGYWRETGNLIFHVSLVVLLVAVAIGALWGWRGQAIVVEGEGFSNTVTQYDTFQAGRAVDPAGMAPFQLTLDDFRAEFAPSGPQQGSPTSFEADVTYVTEPGAPEESAQIRVNAPLGIDNAKVFLVGHGYAPVVEVKNADGEVVYDAATVFLPIDPGLTSRGVVKLPDTRPQLGLLGIFLPTTLVDHERGPISIFPAPMDPSIFFSAWTGNLGLDSGRPQSVYDLPTDNLDQVGLKAIRLGESWELPDGFGTVTFTGLKEFAAIDVAHDPGKELALAAAVAAIGGLMLSLFVPRRRVFVRLMPGEGLEREIQCGGVSRTDEAGLLPAVESVAGKAQEHLPTVESGSNGDAN